MMNENKTKLIAIRLTDQEGRNLIKNCVDNKESISFAVRKGLNNLHLLTNDKEQCRSATLEQ